MNVDLLKRYKISFQIGVKGNKFPDGETVLSSYLVAWRDSDDIDDFIRDIDLCLNGNISQILEPYYISDVNEICGGLTPDALILSDFNGNNKTFVPLADFKEILLSWKEFLSQ
ncbi:MAG: hypothetical protein ABI113_09925 [Mucilaginibacter sp.]